MLEHYAPACVVINAQGDAVYFSGHTGRYLNRPPGRPPCNVLSMARDGSAAAAARRPTSGRDAAPAGRVRAGLCPDQRRRTAHHPGRPAADRQPDADVPLYLVIFQDVAPAGSTAHHRLKAATPASEDGTYPASGSTSSGPPGSTCKPSSKNWKPSNEELSSTNEELHSTNEELETSKEELQSLNEELETVNSGTTPQDGGPQPQQQ